MNKDVIQEYYYLTLLDIREGVPLDELEEIIKLYEDVEDYEACAGILKAIQKTKYDTIQNIIKLENERDNYDSTD